MAPTVGIEVNNSKNVTITECYFSGYQFAINSGYECTNLTVTHCEMGGGRMAPSAAACPRSRPSATAAPAATTVRKRSSS